MDLSEAELREKVALEGLKYYYIIIMMMVVVVVSM